MQVQNRTWFPDVRFLADNCTLWDKELQEGTVKKLGQIQSEGNTYSVIGGDALYGFEKGLGSFHSKSGVSSASTDIGFFGCATKEIAKHFGLYFGIVIMEAMYSDIIDFQVVE